MGVGRPQSKTGHTRDGHSLYRGLGTLDVRVEDIEAQLADQVTEQGDVVVVPGQAPQVFPADPFIIDRTVATEGEYPTMDFRWTPGGDVEKIKAVVRRVRANGSLGRKIEDGFDEIEEIHKSVGAYSAAFSKALKFQATYVLWRIISWSSTGKRTFNQTDPPTSQQDPNYGLLTFQTGGPQRTQPKPGQLIRNGSFERSKKAYKKSVGANDHLECFGWFLNCNRTRAITAAGHPAPSANPAWDKGAGQLSGWNSPATKPSNRIKNRKLRPGKTYYLNAHVAQGNLFNNFAADILAELVSISGSTGAGSVNVQTVIASGIVRNVGGVSSGFVEELGGGGEVAAITGPPDDPPTQQPVGINYQEIEIPLTVSTSYVLASTPTPDAVGGSDDNGQWVRLSLLNAVGTGSFKVSDCRLGRTPGGYTEHPQEETDEVDDVDITGGLTDTQHGSDFLDSPIGVILRAPTEP
jgi:hypothetical protein